MNIGRFILAVILAIILGVPVLSHAQRVIVDISDPEADDRGPGYYGYPANPVFKPGVFDLIRFQVVDEGKYVAFKFTFKDLGGNPWGGPNGFSLQSIHVYVRTTQTGLPSRTDTLGLNIVFHPLFAWHFAIIIVPGWEEKVVPEGQRSGIYYYGRSIVQDDVLRIIIEGDTIIARVDKDILIDVENIASWTIVVAIASYDGFGPNRVRPVGPTGGEWVLNGTRYATPEQRTKIAKAIAAGIEPRVLDLTTYSPQYKGVDVATQYRWLDSFNVDLNLMAMIPPVELKPVTITAVTTETKTEIKTETLPVTTAITQINWPISIVLLIVGLIVGAIVVRFIFR
ncbi:MAG: glucodextranase DOMON-like domain-containing protein [Acidilobaceae archaeon]